MKTRKIKFIASAVAVVIACGYVSNADTLNIDNVSGGVNDNTNVYVVPGTGKIKTYNRFIDPFSKEAQEQNATNSNQLPFLSNYSRATKSSMPTYGLPSYGLPSYGVGFMPKPLGASYAPVPRSHGYNIMGSSINASNGAITTSMSASGIGSTNPSLSSGISGGLIGSISTGMVATIQDGNTKTNYEKHTSAKGIVNFGQIMSYRSNIRNNND